MINTIAGRYWTGCPIARVIGRQAVEGREESEAGRPVGKTANTHGPAPTALRKHVVVARNDAPLQRGTADHGHLSRMEAMVRPEGAPPQLRHSAG